MVRNLCRTDVTMSNHKDIKTIFIRGHQKSFFFLFGCSTSQESFRHLKSVSDTYCFPNSKRLSARPLSTIFKAFFFLLISVLSHPLKAWSAGSTLITTLSKVSAILGIETTLVETRYLYNISHMYLTKLYKNKNWLKFLF